MVSPGCLQTLEIPILSGRDFTSADNKDSIPVVMINATLARRYFQGVDPIGKRLIVGLNGEHALEIVGVVVSMATAGRNVRHEFGDRRQTPPCGVTAVFAVPENRCRP